MRSTRARVPHRPRPRPRRVRVRGRGPRRTGAQGRRLAVHRAPRRGRAAAARARAAPTTSCSPRRSSTTWSRTPITTLDEIRERFGPDVGELVEAMTEDKSIEPYEARKEHHRDQVEAAGERAGAHLRRRQAREPARHALALRERRRGRWRQVQGSARRPRPALARRRRDGRARCCPSWTSSPRCAPSSTRSTRSGRRRRDRRLRPLPRRQAPERGAAAARGGGELLRRRRRVRLARA